MFCEIGKKSWHYRLDCLLGCMTMMSIENVKNADGQEGQHAYCRVEQQGDCRGIQSGAVRRRATHLQSVHRFILLPLYFPQLLLSSLFHLFPLSKRIALPSPTAANSIVRVHENERNSSLKERKRNEIGNFCRNGCTCTWMDEILE